MKTYFVTATGTEIGKTFVTAHLLRQLRAAGRSVLALKPVASGVDPSRIAESDPGVLLQALGWPVDGPHVDGISPWRFEAPLAPDQAAARVGRSLDFEAVVGFSRLPRDVDVLLVEGFGGAKVPLGRTRTVIDWIRALEAPAILVGGTYLGSISHLLTALDALWAGGAKVQGVVLNRSEEEPMPVEETVEAVRPFCRDVPVVVFPRMHEADDALGPDLIGPLGLIDPPRSP